MKIFILFFTLLFSNSFISFLFHFVDEEKKYALNILVWACWGWREQKVKENVENVKKSLLFYETFFQWRGKNTWKNVKS